MEQMIAFITDDSNKKAFGKSGRRLAGTAILLGKNRPTSKLGPTIASRASREIDLY